MSIQPNNTNLPLIQQALLTKDNGQVALHKRMPMYCDKPKNKPLTMDKRSGYTKRQHGCIHLWLYHTHTCMHTCIEPTLCPVMPWHQSRYRLCCGNRQAYRIGKPWVYSKPSDYRTRATGGYGQNQFMDIMCMWNSVITCTLVPENSVYKFFLCSCLGELKLLVICL